MVIVGSRSKCERIIFFYFQVFGLFPFHVSANGLRLGRISLLWSLCVLLITYSGVVVLYIRRLEFRISPVLTVSTIFLHITLALGAGLSLFRIYRFRKELNLIILTVRSAQAYLGLPPTRYGYFSVISIIPFVTLVFCEVLHFVHEEKSYLKLSHSIFSVYIIIGITSTHQIVWFLCRMIECYAKINFILESAGYYSNRVMRRFVVINDDLTNCAELLNASYDPQLLFIFLDALICCASAALLTSYTINLYLRVSLIAFVLVSTWLPVLLIYYCECLTSEAAKFNRLMTSCALTDKSEQLLKNPYAILHFVTAKPIKFTACRFFNVDYRLGGSMVAALITYLVILFQLDNSKRYAASELSNGTAASLAPDYH